MVVVVFAIGIGDDSSSNGRGISHGSRGTSIGRGDDSSSKVRSRCCKGNSRGIGHISESIYIISLF